MCEQIPGVAGDRKEWCAAVHGHETDKTEQLNQQLLLLAQCKSKRRNKGHVRKSCDISLEINSQESSSTLKKQII